MARNTSVQFASCRCTFSSYEKQEKGVPRGYVKRRKRGKREKEWELRRDEKSESKK
jgi:hypothetical protein